MALCRITGTVQLPDGSSAANRTITFKRSPESVVAQSGVGIIPDNRTVRVDRNGNVDFELYTGNYIGVVDLQRNEGRVVFAFPVPDAATANFQDILQAVDPVAPLPSWLTEALAARDEAEGFAGSAEAAAERAEAAALYAVGVSAGYFGVTKQAAGAENSARLNAAIAEVSAAGGGEIVFESGSYDFTQTVIGQANVKLRSKGRTTFRKLGTSSAFTASGSRDVTQENFLLVSAPYGSQTLSIGGLKAGNLAAGDWVLVCSEASMWTGNLQKRGEIASVVSVNYASGVVTLGSPLQFTYNVSDMAQVQKLNLLQGVEIENINFKYDDALASTNNITAYHYCYQPKLKGCHVSDAKTAGFGFFGCVNGRVLNCSASDLLSDTANVHLGYGVAECGANLGLVVDGFTSERCRHAYTTVNSNFLPYGVPSFSRVTGGVATDMLASAWDTHEESFGIEFIGCAVRGTLGHGFQIRGHSCKVTGGNVFGSTGSIVSIVHYAKDTVVDGVLGELTNLGLSDQGIDYTTYGAIEDRGINSVVSNIKSIRAGGPVLQAGVDFEHGVWQNIIGIDPCQINTSIKYAIGSSITSATSVTLNGYVIRSSDGKMDYGVYFNNSQVDVKATGGRVTGEQIAKLHLNNAHFGLGNFDVSAVSFGKKMPRTIAAGVLNLRSVDAAVIDVSGEGNVADDLDTILGASNGSVIMLRRGTGNITIKHSTNIILKGAADAVLDSSSKLISLMRLDNAFIEVSRNF